MKYKKLKKTSSSTDSLFIEEGAPPAFGAFYPYDCASVYKLFDSNYSVPPGVKWLLSKGGGVLKTSSKKVI